MAWKCRQCGLPHVGLYPDPPPAGQCQCDRPLTGRSARTDRVPRSVNLRDTSEHATDLYCIACRKEHPNPAKDESAWMRSRRA